jgi:adenylyltransferase/sulfurtransferase
MSDTPPSLLIYSALALPPFRTIKLRSRKSDCIACGDDTSGGQLIDQSDYLELCGSLTPDYETLGLLAGEAGQRIRAAVSILTLVLQSSQRDAHRICMPLLTTKTQW